MIGLAEHSSEPLARPLSSLSLPSFSLFLPPPPPFLYFLRARSLSLCRACALSNLASAIQICSAMQAVSKAGIVHRDLAAHNVLVSAEQARSYQGDLTGRK